MTETQLNKNQVISIVDGWVPANETWIYASATTITVPSGAASRYSKGDKIKITQSSTVKYFYIIGVADTVLTVISDYTVTVANATISANYYSKAVTPVGFPITFTMAAPTWTSTGTAFGAYTPTSTTKFWIIGNVIYFELTGLSHASQVATGIFILTYASPYPYISSMGGQGGGNLSDVTLIGITTNGLVVYLFNYLSTTPFGTAKYFGACWRGTY